MTYPTKPTKKQIEKWCQALRSGEYKQTRSKLQDKDGYCCMGVAVKEFVPDKHINLNILGYINGGTPCEQLGAPEWLKFVAERFTEKTQESLYRLNDDLDFTFDEIADLLELVFIHRAFDLFHSNVTRRCKWNRELFG